MTDTHRPAPCHYDRHLNQRVTREHRDDCPDPAGHRGCVPCTAPHCVVCGREHATNDHPLTCPECLGKVRDDLDTIRTSYAALAPEATDAARDGRLAAAAPIPGGAAQVLIGPTVRLDLVRVSRQMSKDHHVKDPIPPLAVLAQWEDLYRSWLDHHDQPTNSGRPATVRWGQYVTGPRRATIGRAISYLQAQLDYIAQRAGDGIPEWVEFATQIRTIRARLERTLHNEQAPQIGVECFECGDQLVRRFRDAHHCRHATPARGELQAWLTRRNTAQDWLRTIATYPELGGPRQDELVAAAAPPASLLAAARRPCAACVSKQGGIDDPSPGMSWECPGCRKEYDPGEYATAVRRDLLERGMDGDGWTHVQMAADAASTMTGHHVLAGTVRKWVERGKVDSRVTERGARLVYWPDVADEAVAAVRRAVLAAEARRRKAEREAS